jgi:integral membrane protein (TIGR00529 family)
MTADSPFFDLGAVLVSLVLLMVVARKSLWVAFAAASSLLGLLTLPVPEFLEVTRRTFSDTSLVVFSIAVGLIPLIGGILETGGLLDALVKGLTLPRRYFIALSPAAMGMLPVPGGALLSAPLVARVGDDIGSDVKAACNVWFRHVLILFYPLGTLLATTKMANVDLYGAVAYTVPLSLLMLASGYQFLLVPIRGRMPGKGRLRISAVAIPFFIILIPPLLHALLLRTAPWVGDEVHLLVSVSAALFVGSRIGKVDRDKFAEAVRRIRPWRYMLLMLGVFYFMYIFEATAVSELIAQSAASPFFLMVVVGCALGLMTGRVNLPIALLVPVLSVSGRGDLGACEFAIMHFAVFIGYVISPVHPCVLVSMQYFDTGYYASVRRLLLPSLICFALVAAVGSYVLT